MLRSISALTLCCAVTACAGDRPQFVLQEVEFSRPAGSGEASLHAAGDGTAMLTWLEPIGDERFALRLAARTEGEWSQARTIVQSDRFFVNWADFPSLTTLENGTALVHWLEKAGPGTYAYHVKVALSADGGRTWGAPFVPHRDRSPTEHGFVSMVPWGSGAALVWLDGRGMSVDTAALDAGDMTLRGTTVSGGGAIGDEFLLDDRTCECCQTALARTTSGLVAAYRDRSAGEIRDIAVVRHAHGEWTEPRVVARDDFHYPGCPVNGPQLAALGDTVAVAWYTAPQQQAKVQVAFSTDGGASFDAPIPVDGGDPLGRVDVELLPDGSALVVWVERTAHAAEVRARRVARNGDADPAWLVAETVPSRGSGVPRMARVGDEVLFVWTLVGEQGGIRVRSARVE
jgi:hypothetical protein